MLWFVLFLFIVALIYINTEKPKNFPPGPRWVPLGSILLQVLNKKSINKSLTEATAEMSKNFGPVLGLKVGKDPIIIIYGPHIIKEFSTSDDFIGRPIGLYYNLRTWGKRLGILLTDEEVWQEQKRFIVKHLRKFGYGSNNMTFILQEEIKYLSDSLEEAISNSGYIICDIRNFFNVGILNTLWKLISGKRYGYEDRYMVELQNILTKLFKTIHMTGAPFSHFPFLKYISPEMSGYKCYIDAHISVWNFLRNELQCHKRILNLNTDPTNLMDTYLAQLNSIENGTSFTEAQLLAICMDMFMAGSETTNNTLKFCFQHLILNQDIQRKAQLEIDDVLRGRLPTLEDRLKMPYMESIVSESLRMFGGRAITVPHRALKDTKIAGFNVPKNTVIAANLHGCMMGPDSGFKNPECFVPERFLGKDKLSIPDNFIPFGLGKRRCMGESLARANIFLFTAALLQNYNFFMVPEHPPGMGVADGVTPGPFDFKTKIMKRY
ncbi:probable cytochrome P450 303a1 [Sitophilus oryzae]|uniref:Probable cytochrome P450 303a1 n=1 Tax=Sitophilus oryzae TaxID=7048 RepID=A0A6J2YF96_SITOR|nr:probable cytochrome P450 303a1 [Sitophilus oryzae]